MTQTFPNSNLILTETKVDLPGFLCPFLISRKVSVLSSGFFGLTTVAFDLNLFQSLLKVWVIGSGLNSSYFAYQHIQMHLVTLKKQ